MLNEGLFLLLPYYIMSEALLIRERKIPNLLQDALQASQLI